MRNEINIEQLGTPVHNRVLVEVFDTFDEFKSKSGLITIANGAHEDAWADSDVSHITEFIIRHGIVSRLPRKVTKGSFDYDTEPEIVPGDIVYWNSISFKEAIPLVHEGKKYLLVDYHEMMFRIRDEKITPINGFALLHSVPKTEKVLAYSNTTMITEKWEIVYMPEKLNKELLPRNEFKNIWEVGDIVYLMVVKSPFKVEGSMNKFLDEELFAIPLRMILCSI